MRKFFRSPVVAILVLLFSILMLPSAEAARRGLKSAVTANPSDGGGGRVTPAGPAPQEEPTPETFADLRVSKTVDFEQATPGMNLTYTITVQNGEAFSIPNVTLTDVLPEDFVFVSLTKPNGWTCTTPQAGTNGTVECTNQNLAANANDVFTLVVNIPANVPPGSIYTNVATVSSPAFPDANEENNSSPATTAVQPKNANLTVTKVVDSEQVSAGENLTYTITVHNGGPDAAENATLNDNLPGGTTFVSFTSPAGWTCTTPQVGDGGAVSCTNPSLAANTDSVFTLIVNVTSDAQAGDSFTNTATVGSTTDNNEEDNSSSATSAISSADLEVFKTDSPDPVGPGANLTYTITVQNNGPNTAMDVSLNDTLPAGTTFVSLSSPEGWLCSKPAVGAGGTVTCTAGTLLSSAVFTLVVNVDPVVSNGTVLTNTATAASKTPDPISVNNDGTSTTTVRSLRAWTTAGDSGVTEDESNPARPVYTNFTAAVSPSAPVGTYVLRYNIQATDSLFGSNPTTRLRVRFRDEGEGSRVTVAIMRSPILGGVATLGTIFNSDNYTPSSGFQTQEITFTGVAFDFTQNTYWLEVTLTKTGAGSQPGFGSAQINRQ